MMENLLPNDPLKLKIFLLGGLSSIITYKVGKELFRLLQTDNVYETEDMLNQYCTFHYGTNNEIFSYKDISDIAAGAFNFSARLASVCIDSCPLENRSNKRALDIGCAVGRASFELANHFDEVVAIDYSAAFINKCKNIQKNRGTFYKIPIEGDLTADAECIISCDNKVDNISFERGDACNLRKDIGQFSCVLASNLLCRLNNPEIFLKKCSELLVKDGILVISAPYTWIDKFTPRANWLCYADPERKLQDEWGRLSPIIKFFNKQIKLENSTDRHKTSATGLLKILESDFSIVREFDTPFIIKETIRRHQFT
ncbi:hypothetical protein SNEBB_006114, partial [Seison nebaliae]